MKIPTSIAVALNFAAALALPSRAVAWDAALDEGLPAADRRDGFTAGVSPTFSLGRARGYPNEVDRINNPAYLADSTMAAGGGGTVWVGGALRDWFTFGLGASAATLSGNDLSASSFTFLIRTEAFPFLGLGGYWRDLSIFGDWGAGSVNLSNASGEVVGEGGSMGMVSMGLAHETFRVDHFAFGPSAQYHAAFSETMKLHAASLGVRAAFYAGP